MRFDQIQDELFYVAPDPNAIKPIICGCKRHAERLRIRLAKPTWWDLVKRGFGWKQKQIQKDSPYRERLVLELWEQRDAGSS